MRSPRHVLPRGRRVGPPNSLRAELIRGGVGSLALKIVAQVLALAVGVILARVLGAERYGVYAFAMAVVGLLAIPVQLGLPQFLTKECAVYLHRGEYGLLRGLVWRSGQLVLVVSIAIAVVASLVMRAFEPDSISRVAQVDTASWAIVLIPILGLTAVRSGILRGLGRVVLADLPDDLVRPALFVGLLLVLLVRPHPQAIDPLTVVLVQVLASTSAFFVGVWLMFRSLPTLVRTVRPETKTKEWLLQAAPFLFLASGEIVMQYTNTLLLGLLATNAEVGIYRVVSQGAFLLVFGLIVIDRVIAPRIATLCEARDTATVQRMLTLGARSALFVASPIALAYVFWGRQILSMVFGQSFVGGYWPLVILTAARLCDVAFGSANTVLNMTGYARITAMGIGMAGLINVLLAALLIPRFGASGAALATLASLLFWNAFLTWNTWKKTGLLPWVFGTAKHT